ncbi:hypothetical protein [Halonatronum saccharophilum]|uniref:hypothetical protein n=1 Tax=Halonatronum saccharophilum TaxID=150060 RepID=UPI000482847E|nr:hypothetical protein [Halonatronum saccharophilum]
MKNLKVLIIFVLSNLIKIITLPLFMPDLRFRFNKFLSNRPALSFSNISSRINNFLVGPNPSFLMIFFLAFLGLLYYKYV